MKTSHAALFYISGFLMLLNPLATSALQATSDDSDSSGYCPNLTMTLQRGSRDATTGGQVNELQAFLTDHFSLADNQLLSGFFGRLTQSYVQKFQREEGLPAYGIVGSLTRARVREICGTNDGAPICPVFQQLRCASDEEYISGGRDAKGCATQGWCKPKTIASDFYAKPTEGLAPLSVTFYAMVGGRAQYAVDFGDGTGAQSIACVAPADACVSPGKVSHEYGKVGTYVATLKRVYRIMELQPGDRIMGPLATLSIQVKEKEIVPVTPDSRCRVWYDGCNTCTRDTIGGALGCTKMACVLGGSGAQEPRAFCKEYFATGKTDYPPSITGFSGPTQLDVNQDGVWRIEATDKEGQQLSYSVDWGEYYSGASQTTSGVVKFSQAASFSHRYGQAGTYTVAITVYDTAGGSATSSSTVSIGTGGMCTGQYQPQCGERRVCTSSECWNEKKTYSNTCALRAEGASFLYEGECSTTTCRAGGNTYSEGSKTSCIDSGSAQGASAIMSMIALPAQTCITHAYYVCRSGAWKVEPK